MGLKIDLTELIKDVKKNEQLISKEDTQFHRRNYIRALFSLFEASLSNLREEVATKLNNKILQQETFSILQFLPLLDEDVQLKSNGELNYVPNKYPFKNQVAYIFKKYAELTNTKINPLSNHKWDSFRKAIKIRNRITHPTDLYDTQISDDELKIIFEANEWWQESIISLSEKN